jgi:CRP-like cAMP-binding protein
MHRLESPGSNQHALQVPVRATSPIEARGDRSAIRISRALDALLRMAARPRVFKRGAIVVERGDEAPGLFCVESGAIAVVGLTLSRREFIFRFRQVGEWFGETTLFDQVPWPYEHVASVKTTVLHIPHRTALRLVEAHPALRDEFVRITCARLRVTAQYVEELIVPDLPARLAYHLLVMAREAASRLAAGGKLEVHLTQAALASLLGATREAVGRHLVRWRDAGWVGLRYRRVTILDANALDAIANGEPAPVERSLPRQRKTLVRVS